MTIRTARRTFVAWLGGALLSLAGRSTAEEPAAEEAVAETANEARVAGGQEAESTRAEHWSVAKSDHWQWFERENLIDGEWVLTGITTPVNKETGEPYAAGEGYLDEALVPEDLRKHPDAEGAKDETAGDEPPAPSATRRARHGRPPSKWLRSRKADELHEWLPTIDVPEADVSGMTFWTHLVRDHAFIPDNIRGLSADEQAKLHAAAHYGY